MANKELTLGSLFSGSGGFELGGILAGIKPVWKSEIETFPIRVTEKRLPEVKHCGDVNKLNGADLPPVDIITFGLPCQGLSQAGLRKGLADARSGLYIEAVRIIKEMLEATKGEYPKFCVFENVQGLLTSSGGEDFIACMDMMQELHLIPDINMLDSQDMGVPQRRKRVYITWINIDYILMKRTNISDSIILQLLTELLLLNLGELLRVFAEDPKNSVFRERKDFADGVQKRINLFSLQKEDRLKKLQKHLEEIQAICLNEHIKSDLCRGEDQTVNMPMQKDIKCEVLKTERSFLNIGQLLRSVLEESSRLLNVSTISTPTKETMLQKICSCLQDLQNTLIVTIRLTQLLKKMPMFLNCYEWVKLSLTEIGGCIDAALKYYKGFEELEWYDLLRIYKQKFSEIEDISQRYITDRCGYEILSNTQSLLRYSAESFNAWKNSAGCVTQGSGTAGKICLNDQGCGSPVETSQPTAEKHRPSRQARPGNRMDITDEMTSTLRAEAHHPPVVMESAGFCTEHSAKSRSIGYEEEMSPTLRAGVVPAAVCFENHSMDTRYRQLGDIAPTVSANYGMGGNNQPFVVEKTYDVRLTSEGTKNARQNVYETDTARTVDTGGIPPDANQGGIAVVEAYGICSKDSNAMKSNNPNSGFYKADTSRTIDGNGGDPSCNQGGIAVVAVEGCGSPVETSQPTAEKHRPSRQARPGTRPSHHGNGYSEEGVGYTLNTTEQHGVAYGIDRATYNMGQNAQYAISIQEEVEPTMVAKGPGAVAHPTYCTSKSSFHTTAEKELANTLVASDYKDPPAVNDTDNEMEYIVRRLTPTECARLQGFPDWWCSELASENPTDEEIAKWREIFKEYDDALGKKTKLKTDNQIRKWLQNPHSDSAEYKMWGNGVSLPVVFFVLAGIKWAVDENIS